MCVLIRKTYELIMYCQFSGSNLRKISSFQKKMPTISGDYLLVVGLFFCIKTTINIDKTCYQCKKPTNISFICNLVGFSCKLLS